MQDDTEVRTAFLNRRDWGSHLRALHNAATYPKVLGAVKSSRNWLTQGASQASSWLVGNTDPADEFSTG